MPELVGGAPLQVPALASSTPKRHLQDLSHRSPAFPLLEPWSHSSLNFGSYFPSPQPVGVAPREMMYGRPRVSSAKFCDPTPRMPMAMARAWKPPRPEVGFSAKASCTLHLQLLSDASVSEVIASDVATM